MLGNDPDNTRAPLITLIVCFLIAGVIFVTNRGDDRTISLTQTKIENSFAPALAFLSKPIRATENIFASLEDRSHALEENKALRAELRELREAQQRAEILAMKLARFEQLLKADPGIDIPAEKIAARAVSEISGPFVHSALINAGASKGIKKGHPVMTPDGLYGHVVSTGKNSARVLQLADLNSRIAVMSPRSQATAILAGDNSDIPSLIFLSNAEGWQEGDKIITSGDAGVFPRGLPIGTVRKDKAGQNKVILNVAGKLTDWIWVYPFETIPTPEENPAEPGAEATASLPIAEETP